MSLRIRRVRNIAADLTLGAVMPLAAVAVLEGQRALGLGVLTVALLVLATRWAQERRRLEFRWDILGQYLEMRALATACVAAVLVGSARRPVDVVGAVLGSLVLESLLVREPLLKIEAEKTIPVVVNLPGVTPVAERRVPELGMVVAHAAAVLVGLGLAAVGAPALLWPVAALVPLAYALAIVAEGARRTRVGRELMATAPAAVAAYAPELVIHTAHPGPNYHQVMMWLPYLQRTGLRVMVLTRHPGPSQALRDRVGDVPLVQGPELDDLDAMLPASVKAVLYPNAKLGNNSLIKRNPWIRHILVGHGDSDKSTSAAPSHAVYDTIFSSSAAGVRRYAEHGVLIAEEKFEVVGRPQVEDVEQSRGPIGEMAAPTVLYAPTWKGFTVETSVSSISRGVEILTALLQTRVGRVIFRPHPSSYNFVRDRVHIAAIRELLAEDAARTGRPHLFGPPADSELDAVGCMNLADAMISDVSGVAPDFLFSGKPLAMMAAGDDVADFKRRFPVTRGAYVVERDLGNLDEVLVEMLGSDPMAARRREVRSDYHGDQPAENYASIFVDAARRAGTTDKPGATRPATTGRPSVEAAGPVRPSTLRARLGLVRRNVVAGLREPADWEQVLAVVLGSGALAAGLSGSRLVTAVLVVLTTALLARRQVDLRAPRSWFGLVGAYAVARALLVVAVLAAVSATTRDASFVGPGGGHALLACGLGAALTSERLVLGWSEQWPLTRNVPGLSEGRGEPCPGLLIALTAVAELIALALPGQVVTGVLGVLLVAAAVAVAAMALVRIGNGKAVDAAWRAGLLAYDPRFALFVGTNVNPGANVKAWLPHLARLRERFVVITHHAGTVAEVDAVCRTAGLEVPIVFRPKFRGLDKAITPGLNAAFYVHNSLLNNQMVSRRELTHVLLNHREGESAENATPMAAMYDQVFVAGRVARERFARYGVYIPDSKFRLVGRPQLADVERRGLEVDRADAGSFTVLYAPTWFRSDGSRDSSMPDAPAVVSALLTQGARVLFRPDPAWTRYRENREPVAQVAALLEADRAAGGPAHVVAGRGSGSRAALVGLMNESDAMVSDTLAPLYDYLRSEKPFALLSAVADDDAAPLTAAAYGFGAETAGLVDRLRSDPLADVRRRLRVDYLGPDVDDPDAGRAFVTAACSAVASRPALFTDEDEADEDATEDA